MPSLQQTFLHENTSNQTNIDKVTIEVILPIFSFRNHNNRIRRFVSNHKSFKFSHNLDNNTYQFDLPLNKLIGTSSEDIYGFFRYHFIEILNPNEDKNINDFSFYFEIKITDEFGQLLSSNKHEGIYYQKSSFSSDYDEKNYEKELLKFEETYGKSHQANNYNLEKLKEKIDDSLQIDITFNEEGLKALPNQQDSRVFIINKSIFEAFKYTLDLGSLEFKIPNIIVLEFIQILTSLNENVPKINSMEVIGTSYIDFWQKFFKDKYTFPDNFMPKILDNFNSLFDFPITVPEIQTVDIKGSLEVLSETEKTKSDLDNYELLVEYTTNGNSINILSYNWDTSKNGIVDNKIPFEFENDEAIVTNTINGLLTIKIKGFDGAVLWEEKYNPDDESLQNILIKVKEYPFGNIAIDTVTGNPKSIKRLRGKVLQKGDTHKLNDLTVIVQAKIDDDESFKIVSATTTDTLGNFSMDYPYGNYLEAQALVSLIPNSPAELLINSSNSNETISDDFIYLLLSDDEITKSEEDDDCGCHSPVKAKRLPDQADLIDSGEYTQDIGGTCLNLSTPNRTLREYSYNAIVRVSDPDVCNYTLEKKEVGGKTKYDLKRGADSLGRKEIGIDNPIRWEDAPDAEDNLSLYQAVSIATGHILHYKSVFKADGYSLGDLVYSLPLAPGQKKQIVVFESSHSLSGAESQSASQEEGLTNQLINDRSITDRLGGINNEALSGRSKAHTSGMSAGLGASGSYGGIGASLGVAGGFSNANSSASQNSSRNVTQFFDEKLRNSLTQNAESYRQLNASVVTTVTQGQQYGVTTETVANHNHCHSLTMMYFEVLRHYAIFQEISHVEECVFVPLLMTHFTTENIHKWKDILAPNLLPLPSNTYLKSYSYYFGRRQHPLLKAFDANKRIKTNYERVDFPKKNETYADGTITQIKGRFTMNVNIPRPKTKYDRIKSFAVAKKVENVSKNHERGLFGLIPIVGPFLAAGVQDETKVTYHLTKIKDTFISIDDNFDRVPPAQAIRVNTFSKVRVPNILGVEVDVPTDSIFEDGHVDKELWETYSKILGYQGESGVGDMLNYYYAGRLIAEWDEIFYKDLLPLVFARIVDSIAIYSGKTEVEAIELPGNPFHFKLNYGTIGPKLDFSTETNYTGGNRSINVNFNGHFPGNRKDLGGESQNLTVVSTNDDIHALKNFIKLNIGKVQMSYSTAHFEGSIFNGYVNDDLLDGTNLYIPLTSRDKINPQKEDEYIVNELIEHLNSNIEYYNKILWTNLDPDRRFMLLDGFNIQTYASTGQKSVMRSLASVVKNELITIAGNSLVFPVADGYKVGRNYMLEEIGDNVFLETPLLDYYKPLTPMPPYRLSIPTRGVFMEAVKGSCDACEMVKENSSQDWDKFRTEESTPIAQVVTPTPTITDYKPNYKDFAEPLVNIQNAPNAPTPAAGLAGINQLLGKSDAFRDITGLAANQNNALETFKANTAAAQKYAEMATSLAKQQHNTNNAKEIQNDINKAKKAGSISDEDAKKLTQKHLEQQIDGGESLKEDNKNKKGVQKKMNNLNALKNAKSMLENGEISAEDYNKFVAKSYEKEGTGSIIAPENLGDVVDNLGNNANFKYSNSNESFELERLSTGKKIKKSDIESWIPLINFYPPKFVDENVKNRGEDYYVQRINLVNNSNDLNLDLFSIKIEKLPTRYDKKYKEFFKYIRLNLTQFTISWSKFRPLKEPEDKVLWESENPIGSIIHIDLKGPDDAAVVTSYYNESSWVFSTISGGSETGKHPVTGNRMFAYNLHGENMIFYTRGADRTTNLLTFDKAVFAAGAANWINMMSNLVNFINSNGGKAEIKKEYHKQYDWKEVKPYTRYKDDVIV
ncbi:hypothetical protein [Aquimarina sp. 2201CG14-23]|uniref:hypothetical protein n=1 Tax=Aquimarina mycalae TaxID=3040073 RepID=UPI0024782C74|nr:hypothetical protein [Aquimarina sp. 2201CG14-23]MDH7448406.1 hypothetical protein [Aquimarina sp. 2201CG14-23]